MEIERSNLPVVCDGLRLPGGVYVPEEPRGLVVLFHGLPLAALQDPSDEGYEGLAKRFAAAGWAAAWADLRAVRGAPGHFSVEGWIRDGRAIIDAARTVDELHRVPLAVIGSSAGGAVAAECVRRGAPARALVLLAAPADWSRYAVDPQLAIQRMKVDSGMRLPPGVERDPTEWASEFAAVGTAKAVASLSLPILVMHGTDDQVLPVDNAQRIVDRARGAELRIVEGAGHQLRRDPAVVASIMEWLERVL